MDKSPDARHSKAYRDRKKAEESRLGIETLKVEVSSGMNQSLQCLMREHGFSQRQEVYQTLLRYVMALDFEEASRVLRPVTSAFNISPKLARQFRNESLKEIRRDPGDETLPPAIEVGI